MIREGVLRLVQEFVCRLFGHTRGSPLDVEDFALADMAPGLVVRRRWCGRCGRIYPVYEVYGQARD